MLDIYEGTYRITVLGVLLFFLALYIFLYWKVDDAHETLNDVYAAIGGAAVIYAAYATGAAVMDNARRHKADRTFEMLDRYNDLASVEVRQFLRENIEGKKFTTESMLKFLQNKKNKESYARIMSLLGFFEDMAIAVDEDYVDEDLLYRSLGYMVPWTFDLLRPFISEFRQHASQTNHGHDTDALFEEVERLRNRWNRRTRDRGQSKQQK